MALDWRQKLIVMGMSAAERDAHRAALKRAIQQQDALHQDALKREAPGRLTFVAPDVYLRVKQSYEERLREYERVWDELPREGDPGRLGGEVSGLRVHNDPQ